MIPRSKKHTIFHLDETIEELQRIVRQLKSNKNYTAIDFESQIAHAYHHLNYAWNTRRLGSKRAWAAKPKDFAKFRRMPKDVSVESGTVGV